MVICLIATNEVYPPFGYLSPSLVAVLEKARLPLKHSPVIAATWPPYREMVWKVLDSLNNKGSLTILPAGVLGALERVGSAETLLINARLLFLR